MVLIGLMGLGGVGDCWRDDTIFSGLPWSFFKLLFNFSFNIFSLRSLFNNTKKSYIKIFKFINKYYLDYVVVSYESMILYKEKYLNEILKVLGLTKLDSIDIHDGNEKYYDE